MRERILSLLLLFMLIAFHLFSPSLSFAVQDERVALCVRDFQDSNLNGQYDEGEGAFPNIDIRLENSEGVQINRLVTSEAEDCFQDLLPGFYRVQVEGPDSLVVTTANPQSLNLSAPVTRLDVGLVNTGNSLSNEVCVQVFNDPNMNGIRETTEILLPNINVTLRQNGVVIDNLLTRADGYSCFLALAEGAYQVVIPESPRHLMTTRNDAAPSFVGTGNRFSAPFGAVLVDPFTEDAALPDYRGETDSLILDRETRLLLSIMGSGIVILLMIAIGAVLFGFMRR